MKIKLLFCMVIAGMVLPVIAIGQQTFLSSFSGAQITQTVYLSFTIRGGNTCTGTGIERSSDKNYFTRIGEIPGVCGSSSFDETYSFIDHNPVPNEINYYRIKLGLPGGTYSETIAVNYVDYGAYGFKVFPNPAIKKTTIYFPNPKKEVFEFMIYNPLGKLFQHTSLKESFIELNANEFSPGIYHYRLLLKNEIKFSGKIVFL